MATQIIFAVRKLIELFGYFVFPFAWVMFAWRVSVGLPGLVSIGFIERNGELKFELNLPEAPQDVHLRRLKISIGGLEAFELEMDASATKTKELSGNEGDQVWGQLFHVDRAGNESQPREFEFVLADTIAPEMPGELSLALTSDL